MHPVEGELVPSFTIHRTGWQWSGAIYEWHRDVGPELLLECAHHHRTIHRAMACAEAELAFATRVVEIAAEQRPS